MAYSVFSLLPFCCLLATACALVKQAEKLAALESKPLQIIERRVDGNQLVIKLNRKVGWMKCLDSISLNKHKMMGERPANVIIDDIYVAEPWDPDCLSVKRETKKLQDEFKKDLKALRLIGKKVPPKTDTYSDKISALNGEVEEYKSYIVCGPTTYSIFVIDVDEDVTLYRTIEDSFDIPCPPVPVPSP